MDEKVLKTLLKIEVGLLMKKGMSVRAAAEKAGEKMKEELERAEFETYCMGHDC